MLSSVFLFLDIGGGEFMLIALVALLLFGGDKLPELAKGLGKGIRDFKDASDGVKREISNQIDNFESKKKEVAATNDSSDDEQLAEHPPEGYHSDYDSTDNDYHSTDNEYDHTTDESYMANSMPVNNGYVTASDQLEEEKHEQGTVENHGHDTNVSTEPAKTTNG